MTEATVYLGLGSNLGDRLQNLNSAIKALGEIVQLETASSVYETDPVGYVDQPKFLNAACRVACPIDPIELLRKVKEIERQMGRAATIRNGPRVMDIDILLWDDLVMETPELTIPHPRLGERAFVLAPLLEIAPDLVHPATGEKLADALARVGLSGIRQKERRK